ncbi:polysaccharide deacetylase family protein [Saliphagus sp. LR7]|uniref:polysaccharide deacetylase family protein n=1 Tax=Saliphagus sp. LR7 TaxID=2282654 RepID=UPI000DF7BDAB|nr:polysaccharide deacetylase family protein [Saliphagus sp. LR7]
MHRREFLTGVVANGCVLREYALVPDATPHVGRDQRRSTDGDAGGAPLEEAAGLVVFTYDDGPIEDYTMTYRIHREYGVPGCLAVCPGRMEDSGGFLEPGHLREMHGDGWGVLSHTYRHRALGRIGLAEPAREGDRRAYVETHRHGRFEGDPLVVFDDETTVSATVAGRGSDSTGEFVEFEAPLSESIGASGYVRYPERFMRDVLARTDARLESWGVEVSGFVYPYDRYHGAIEGIVRERYGAVANHRYGGGHNGIDGLDPTTMRRRYVQTDKASEAEIAAFMETAATEDVLAIVGAHSQFETFPEERLRYTIETALEYDLAIVTVGEAIAALAGRDDEPAGSSQRPRGSVDTTFPLR